MAKTVSKAASNMYCQARLRAAQFNDSMNSREGAAPYIGVDKDTLAKYELGILRVPCDVVVMMADAYNAPELLNLYCSGECPIGAGRIPSVEVKSIELITLRIMNTLKGVERSKESLLEIVQDGVVEDSEKPALKKVIDYFEQVEHTVCELKLWAEKHLK
jgi:hypothetical protein